MITVLVLLGQVLELRAREATSGAIKALLQRLRYHRDDEVGPWRSGDDVPLNAETRNAPVDANNPRAQGAGMRLIRLLLMRYWLRWARRRLERRR